MSTGFQDALEDDDPTADLVLASEKGKPAPWSRFVSIRDLDSWVRLALSQEMAMPILQKRRFFLSEIGLECKAQIISCQRL